MRSFLKKNLEFFLVFFSSFLLLITLISTTILYIYQERDLSRAEEILKGNFYWLGPEVNKGGQLPGPFYYYLLALPLSLFHSWQAAWYFMVFLFCTGIAMLWQLIRKHYSDFSALIFFILAISHPELKRLIVSFWNPSFLLLFVVTQWLLVFSFLSKKQSTYILYIGFVGGLIVQIHGSGITLSIAFILMMFFKTSSAKEKFKNLLTFCLGFAVSITPYFFDFIHRDKSLLFTGSIREGINNAIDLYTFFLHPSAFLNFDLSRKDIHLIFTTFPALFFLPYCFTKRGATAMRDFLSDYKIKYILLVFIINLPIFLYVFLSRYGDRYFHIFQLTNLFLVSAFCGKLYNKKDKDFLLVTLGLLVCFNMFLGRPRTLPALFYLSSSQITSTAFWITFFSMPVSIIYFLRKNQFFKKTIILFSVLFSGMQFFYLFNYSELSSALIREGNFFSYEDTLALCKAVYSMTGFSFEEFKKRTYALKISEQIGFRYAYLNAMKNFPSSKEWVPNIDGIFIFPNNSQAVSNNSQLLHYMTSLIKNNEIKRQIANHTIILSNPLCLKHYCVWPYKFSPDSLITAFHNIGMEYIEEKNQHDPLVYSEMKKRKDERLIDDHTLIIRWNECGDAKIDCRSAALLTWNWAKTTKLNIGIKIMGRSMASASVTVTPNWTQFWKNPYVKINCDGKRQILMLNTIIGTTGKQSSEDSFLAPFEAQFSFSCTKNKLKAISFGKSGVYVHKYLFAMNNRRHPLESKFLGDIFPGDETETPIVNGRLVPTKTLFDKESR